VPDALAWESFQEVMGRAASRLDGLEVKVSPSFNEILTTGVKVDSTNFIPLFSVERVRITGLDAVLKNLLDYGLSLVLLVLLAPLMAVIALALRWTQESATSRPREAPILDRHLVQGLGGRSFLTLKFRTGSVGSIRRNLLEPLPAKLAGQGTKHDRLNSLLYRTGLDKLPQLFNVVRGQMSLVGPRTISDESGDLYGPWLPGVLTVKPGMTGPWAVYDVPSLDDEIRSAMYYIRNWTIWIDLQVLFSTARRVLQFTAVRGREMASETVADPILEGASARDSDVQPPHTPPPAGAGPDATSHGTRHTREADTVEGEWTQSKPI
jgi:lipopolysaccharide/colanic/teichoic acid biosynthesis glycosyltransferase